MNKTDKEIWELLRKQRDNGSENESYEFSIHINDPKYLEMIQSCFEPQKGYNRNAYGNPKGIMLRMQKVDEYVEHKKVLDMDPVAFKVVKFAKLSNKNEISFEMTIRRKIKPTKKIEDSNKILSIKKKKDN